MKNVYTVLTDNEVKCLKSYINNNLIKRKSINTKHTSYWYKHLFENELGFYISNNDCITAMIECGFNCKHIPHKSENMMFNVSERCLKNKIVHG